MPPTTTVSIPAAPSTAWPMPRDADRSQLERVLARKPVVWIGAGLSMGAGYPSTGNIVAEMNKEAGGTLDTTKDFFAIADDFVNDLSRGALANLLQRLFATPRPPLASHHAIAKLAKDGRLHAIVTTNYDPLIEDALRAAGVPHLLQTLEENAATTGGDELRLLKIHGSFTSWRDTILSGHSYASFTDRYKLLNAQLDVLLVQRPVLFLGCSLKDPRILDWLAKIPEDWAQSLEVWRAVMLEKAWNEALSYTWAGGHASGALLKGNVQPLRVKDHGDLPKLLADVAGMSPTP
jgi:hypothetical protein